MLSINKNFLKVALNKKKQQYYSECITYTLGKKDKISLLCNCVITSLIYY